MADKQPATPAEIFLAVGGSAAPMPEVVTLNPDRRSLTLRFSQNSDQAVWLWAKATSGRPAHGTTLDHPTGGDWHVFGTGEEGGLPGSWMGWSVRAEAWMDGPHPGDGKVRLGTGQEKVDTPMVIKAFLDGVAAGAQQDGDVLAGHTITRRPGLDEVGAEIVDWDCSCGAKASYESLAPSAAERQIAGHLQEVLAAPEHVIDRTHGINRGLNGTPSMTWSCSCGERATYDLLAPPSAEKQIREHFAKVTGAAQAGA